jgi:hypothetical protein
MSDLTFDAATHTYRCGGVVVPSVTQIIGGLHSFAGIPKEVLAAAAERGTDVHAMCEYDDGDGLAEGSYEPELQGYLDAWRLFKREMKPEMIWIEARQFSKQHWFAGTMDRLASMGGSSWVLDIKTAQQAHPTWGLQTAAYKQLLLGVSPHALMCKRGTVQLSKNGTYRLHQWADPDDIGVFLGLAKAINWSKKHGI